jgi:hypothetical protein
LESRDLQDYQASLMQNIKHFALFIPVAGASPQNFKIWTQSPRDFYKIIESDTEQQHLHP